MKTGSKFKSDVEIADSILQNSKFLDSNEIEEKEKPLVLTKEIKENKPLGDDNKNKNLSPAV